MKKLSLVLLVAIMCMSLAACNSSQVAGDPQDGMSAAQWCISQVCLEEALTGHGTFARAEKVTEIGTTTEVPEGYTREVYNVIFCNSGKGEQKETSVYVGIIHNSEDENITEDEILRFEDLS